jgi:NADH-quinone oxidoreductase subunit H
MTSNSILLQLFFIIIFPGFFFLGIYGIFLQWLKNTSYALMENKKTPPIYKPLADLLKLLVKKTIIPQDCNPILFKSLPFISIAAITTSILMIPVSDKALFSFQGDLITVIYLLMIPAIIFFLAEQNSKSLTETNTLNALIRLFAYEALFIIALIGPAILAGSWNIAEISKFMFHRPLLLILQIPAFLIVLITLQGKLQKFPFDESDTIPGITGGLKAFFNLAVTMETVVGAALINAVFLGGVFNATGITAIGIFILKTTLIVVLLAVVKILLSKQNMPLIDLCWKILAPLSFAQIALNIFLKIKMQ